MPDVSEHARQHLGALLREETQPRPTSCSRCAELRNAGHLVFNESAYVALEVSAAGVVCRGGR